MPLTDSQKGVARLLAAHRNPESYVAGGAVINRGPEGLRVSDDLAIFHDAAASVAAAADELALREAGYDVAWTLRREGFAQALVTRGEENLRLDWTTDSAFRFFPTIPDEELGYRLHDADLATNKVLALAGRTEIRAFLDIMLIDATGPHAAKTPATRRCSSSTRPTSIRATRRQTSRPRDWRALSTCRP